MRRRVAVLALIALFAVAVVGRALAQAVPRITGVVTDSSGTPISHATVLIPGTKLMTATDSTGHYHLDSAPATRFSVRAVAQDFKARQVDQLLWDGKKPLKVDFILEPFIEELLPPPVAPPALRR